MSDELSKKAGVGKVDKLTQIKEVYGNVNIYGVDCLPQRPDSIEHYLQTFEISLSEAIPEMKVDFDLTYADGVTTKKPIASIIKQTVDNSRVILQGYAGGGKTRILRKLSTFAQTQNLIPVILNLKNFVPYIETYNKEQDANRKFDLLLKVSIASLNMCSLKNFVGKKFVMLDGLNEIPAGEYGEETVRGIVETIGEYTRQNSDTCVLVTDRPAIRSFMQSMQPAWKKLDLELLSTEEVKQRISEKFGETIYNSLPSASKDLLSKPFFLNLALESPQPDLGYAAKAIYSFFSLQMKLDDTTLDLLAKSSLNTYKTNGSRSFDLAKFKEEVGQNTVDALFNAGVIRVFGNSAEFDHQLKHDYLASRNLSKTREYWDADYFDPLSFNASSTEVLCMALEQLENPKEADDFLKSVYNWHWPVALSCMEWALKTVSKKYSQELEVAILSILSEKLFDPVLNTRNRTHSLLTNLNSESAKAFAKATQFKDILTIVNGISSTTEWFVEWRTLFNRPTEPPISEDELFLISSEDPVIGWSASNVAKRFDLNESDFRQLRAMYYSFRNASFDSRSIRYRIVHTLGACYSEKNQDLLFRAVYQDPYSWVKYGAARSLIEMAAENDGASKSIIDELKRRATELPKPVREEIARTIFYKGAKGNWYKEITQLLAVFRDSQKSVSDKEAWDNKIKEFEIFCTNEGLIK
jgi:hypothetical protein